MSADVAAGLGVALGFGVTQTIWSLSSSGERIWWPPAAIGIVVASFSAACLLALI